MKLLILVTFLSLLSGCTTISTRQAVVSTEEKNYFPVEPTQKTKIVTYHVQVEKLSPTLQNEFEKALAILKGKCWFWAMPSEKETLLKGGPEYCLKFVNFTTVNQLKPYKRDPTEKKMLLSALDEEGHIQVQNYVWDGAKLQRVRNSDSNLRGRSFQDFLILWALK